MPGRSGEAAPRLQGTGRKEADLKTLAALFGLLVVGALVAGGGVFYVLYKYGQDLPA